MPPPPPTVLMSVGAAQSGGGVGKGRHVPMCFQEPEIPEVPVVDKPVVRNVLYTAWALQEHSGGPSIGWQVQLKQDGYLVLVSYGKEFSVALQDLQLIADVNPLRIDSVVVRSPEGGGAGDKVGCVVAVRVLNQQQPVRITEAEIVRVHKRHRGFSLSGIFSGRGS